jgi:hypothetical protein
MTHTHSYALLEVSPSTYTEIRTRLLEAGYGQQIISGTSDTHGNVWETERIEMHGLALTPGAGPARKPISADVREAIHEATADVMVHIEHRLDETLEAVDDKINRQMVEALALIGRGVVEEMARYTASTSSPADPTPPGGYTSEQAMTLTAPPAVNAEGVPYAPPAPPIEQTCEGGC